MEVLVQVVSNVSEHSVATSTGIDFWQWNP